MRATIAILMLLSAGVTRADETGGPWSAPTNGLRARIVARDLWINEGTTTLGVYLELDNVSDVGTPMRIRWSDRVLHFALVDAHGKAIEPSHLPRSGPQPELDLLIVPHDGRLRFRASVTGVANPKGQRWLIALPNEDWVIGNGTEGPLALSATIQVPPPGGTSHDWTGQISVPAVSLTQRKRPARPPL